MPVVIALPELIALCGLILALGMVTMGDQFTRALFQVTEAGIGWIPWIGKKAANGVQAVSQRVNSVFSHAAVRLEGAISDTWHALATLIEQTGKAIYEATEMGARALYAWEVQLPLRLAKLLADAGRNVGGQARTALRPVVKNYYTTKGVTSAQLARYGKRLARLEARMAAVPVIGAGAIALPFPRLGALERTGRATKARLGKLEARFGRKAFAAAVAGALATLGVGWARKPCAKRTADAWCRVDPDLFGALIGGLALIIGTVSLIDLARGMQEITEEVTESARSFIREASAADAGNAPAPALFGIELYAPRG